MAVASQTTANKAQHNHIGGPARRVTAMTVMAHITLMTRAIFPRASLANEAAPIPWFARYGGDPPRRFVAGFNDSDSVTQAAVQGLGVALGRETLARPWIEAGRLVALTRRRLEAGFAYFLVFPPRSCEHRGFVAFRDWLYGQLGRESPPLPLD